jgi:hypothetical protein
MLPRTSLPKALTGTKKNYDEMQRRLTSATAGSCLNITPNMSGVVTLRDRYWYETLAASPSNMHARRHYLVSSVRGMEVLVHQFRWTSKYVTCIDMCDTH